MSKPKDRSKWETTCPHCGRKFKGGFAFAGLKSHTPVCPKNPDGRRATMDPFAGATLKKATKPNGEFHV